MRFHSTARRIWLAPVLGLALTAAISGCSNGSSSSSTPGSSATDVAPSSVRPSAQSAPASPAGTATSSSAAVAQITADWDAFFNPKTANSKRVQLLQNGSEFTAALSAFSSSPLASAVTSKVDSVALTSSTQATVTYNLSAAGTTVATGAKGTSVLQDGVWKVGDTVFCGLLTEAKSAGITIAVPAACS